jgi:dihydrolipoamide dehydrogenase
MKQLDVAIIGAGTAGLSARSEVAKLTENYLVFDGGNLGTTCARVGCMPSKVFIQVANDFHTLTKFEKRGFRGQSNVTIDDGAVMQHLRSLRDRFVRAVVGSFDAWQEKHLVRHHARFVDGNTIEAGGERYQAKKIIIATGGRPSMPRDWEALSKWISTSDDVFEWQSLPKSVAVIGLGVIGVELGQALARLGVRVVALSLDKAVGGLTDPVLQEYAVAALAKEFEINVSGVASLSADGEGLLVKAGNGSEYRVERALVAAGRKLNLDALNLAATGLNVNERGLPRFDEGTHRIEDSDIYIAGDVDGTRPLLHEAADEGWIAGYNAVRASDSCFARRTPLSITFSEPNIALVGESHRALVARGADFVTGTVCFEGYGRAIIRLQEVGLVHIYADRKTGKLLGAEMFAPAGEHLAHLIVWAIAAGYSVDEALALPFYHPVFEEGIKTALRECRSQLSLPSRPLELFRCQESGATMG